MAKRVQYEIIGRYMSGKEVTGYHLRGDNGNDKRYTREQVCYLVGKGQVVNCKGQIYQDYVLLRGVGINLEDLPVVSDKDGSLSRTDNIGKVRRGVSAQDALTQLMIVGVMVNGRNAIGYHVKTSGGMTKRLSRQDVLTLARDGRIGNARVQEYKGKLLLRGVGVDLSRLPSENVGQA